MNKINRTILQVIGVALALICGFLAIMCFLCIVIEGESDAWIIFLLYLLGGVIGFFCIYLTYSNRLENAICKSYFADAIRLGGKQMLCDIIKWTIIIIIAAIIFSIAYKINVSPKSNDSTPSVSLRYK